MGSDVGGLLIVMGLALLYVFAIIPMKPGRATDDLIARGQGGSYFDRRHAAYAKAGGALWSMRHVLRGGAVLVVAIGLALVVL